MSQTAIRLRVEGKVQGVFYRQSTREKARELKLHGWVKNCSDGSVEIHVEGEQNTITELVSWCHQGPKNAMVTKLTESQTEWVGYSDFRIIR